MFDHWADTSLHLLLKVSMTVKTAAIKKFVTRRKVFRFSRAIVNENSQQQEDYASE